MFKSLQFLPETKDPVDMIDLIVQLDFSREGCIGKQARVEEKFLNLSCAQSTAKTIMYNAGHVLTPAEGGIDPVSQVVGVLLMDVFNTDLSLHHHDRSRLELEDSVGELTGFVSFPSTKRAAKPVYFDRSHRGSPVAFVFPCRRIV